MGKLEWAVVTINGMIFEKITTGVYGTKAMFMKASSHRIAGPGRKLTVSDSEIFDVFRQASDLVTTTIGTAD